MSVIDPELIQRYYSQLASQELIDLTKNEGNKLTDEAIDYLLDEFVNRGMDTTILQQMVETREQIRKDAHMDTSNWSYALEAKKLGKTDAEIIQELTARQISEREAALIIKRLPNFNYENEQFENMISKKSQSTALGAVFGILILFALGAYFLYLGIVSKFFLPLIFGVAVVIFGIWLLRKNDKEFKGGEFWIDLLKSQPENFIWIKPIVTKHTVGFVLTLWRDQKFQLCTINNEQLLLTIDTEEERLIFFEGIQQLLPHAHIGFTYEIDALYSSNPETFIATLQEWQLYTPFDALAKPSPESNLFVENDAS
jgi:sensor histidine kinase YesM